VISQHEIDQLLLSFCNTQWQKVAKVIGNVLQVFEKRQIRCNAVLAVTIDARMAILVRNGKLEAQGNIRKWRYSEVRQPIARALAE
jgi:hypothetical protein